MSFCKKHRSCTDCGFLTIRERELFQTERTEFSSADGRNNSDALYTDEMSCYRDQWTARYVEGSIEDADLDRELHEDRRDCRYFFEYEPNYTPKQHRDRQDDLRKEKLQLRIALLGFAGALLGGLLGTLLPFLLAFFGGDRNSQIPEQASPRERFP